MTRRSRPQPPAQPAGLWARAAAVLLASLLAGVAVPAPAGGAPEPPRLAGPVAADLAAEQPQVLFLDPRVGLTDPGDVGFPGASEEAALLRGWGYAVSQAAMPLQEALAWLRPGDMLVLPLGERARYPPGDVDAVAGFVERGGGVLFFGEHDVFHDTLGQHGELAARFGIRFLPDGVTDPRSEAASSKWAIVDAPAWGVREAVLLWPGVMELSGDAVAIARASPQATPPEAIVVAESRLGLGRAVAVADIEWQWNGDPDVGGIHRRNTSLLLRAIAERLTGRAAEREGLVEPSHALFTGDFELRARVAEGVSVALSIDGGTAQPVPAPPGELRWSVAVQRDGWLSIEAALGAARDRDVVRFLAPPAKPLGSAAMLQDGLARAPHAGPWGTLALARALRDAGFAVEAASSADLQLEDFDVALWVHPLRPAPGLAARAAAAPAVRWVVATEPWGTLSECDNGACEFLQGLGGSDPPRPIDELAGVVGARFPHGVAIGPAPFPQQPAARWLGGEAFPTWRAAPLLAERPDARAWAALGWEGWLERLAFIFKAADNEPAYDLPGDARLPRLLLAHERALVLGDADWLSNAHLEPLVLARLQRWLAPQRLDLDVQGVAEAGQRFDARVAAVGMTPARLEVLLPPGVGVLDAGGAAVEPGPEGTLLRWQGSEARFAAEAPLGEGWLLLRARAEAGGMTLDAEEPVRVAAPRLALRLGAPASLAPLQDFVARVAVFNEGDAGAGDAHLWLNASLDYAPEPSFSDPPGFGEPAGNASLGAEGWSFRWGPGALAPEEHDRAALAMHAPAPPGGYALRAEASASTRVGFVAQASALQPQDVTLG